MVTARPPEKVPKKKLKIKIALFTIKKISKILSRTTQTKDNSFEELSPMKVVWGTSGEAKKVDYRFKIDKTLHNPKFRPM
ncbi:MAG: hypothetical protein U5N85_13715 [Arcicella sp.]|nr:hypothetical protein [Arcicella sp.]